MRFKRSAPVTIAVGRPRSSVAEQCWRVEADVDGEPLWFESPDVPLDPAPEGFACAVIPLAAMRNARLKVEAPLDAALIANVPALLEVLRGWWGRPRDPRLILSGLSPRLDVERSAPGNLGIGLCFRPAPAM